MHGHMASVEIKEKQAPALWWKRFLNALIDYSVIWWLSVRLVTYCVESFAFSRDFFWIQITFLSIVLVFFGYFFVFEYFLHCTPGKYITRTRLKYLGKVSAWAVLKRTALRLVPLDAITFLGHSHPAGWHDYFSGTTVIDLSATKKELSLDKTSTLPTWKRFFARIIISFSLFTVVFIVVMPLVVFHRWNSVQILNPAEYEWKISTSIEEFDLYVPGSERKNRRSLSAIRLRGVQMLLITALGAEETPEDKLQQDISLLTLHPLMLIKLSEYEEISMTDGDLVWYRYSVEQAPFFANGFFFKPKEGNNWYQFDSQGFKVDARLILRHMWDQLMIEQSNEL